MDFDKMQKREKSNENEGHSKNDFDIGKNNNVV